MSKVIYKFSISALLLISAVWGLSHRAHRQEGLSYRAPASKVFGFRIPASGTQELLDQSIAASPCADALHQALSRLGATGGWMEDNSTNSFIHFPGDDMTSFTLKFTDGSRDTTLTRGLPNQTMTLEYYTGHCDPQPAMSEGPESNLAEGKQWLTTFELTGLLAKRETGLLYVWSPSDRALDHDIKQIQAAAEQRSLPISFLLAPEASQADAEAAVHRLGLSADSLRRAVANALTVRKIAAETPSVLLFARGHLCMKPHSLAEALTSGDFEPPFAELFTECVSGK